MNNVKNIAILIIIIFIQIGCSASTPIYIRSNQVGFFTDDVKTAVVFSQENITNKKFDIKNIRNNRIVYSDYLKNNFGTFGNFINNYVIDFSIVREPGTYIINIDGQQSYNFNISRNVFNGIVDSLMLFFKVQRCGPTNPLLHEPCHLSDATSIVGENSIENADLTGGWHDAADYVKFLSTTAYTTYLLIFSYEFDKVRFSFDNDNNGVPDILEEAKVGLDWLLRANFLGNKLITQVQDLRDHDVGWRLPENDSLQYDRPGYVGIGKNQIGFYSAALAIGARVWREKFQDYEFAGRLQRAAENIYSLKNRAPDVDEIQSGMYQDNKYFGKLALGGIELFLTTGLNNYLNDAKEMADSAGSEYWWSWGDVAALAQYRLAKIEPRFGNYILNNLNAFNENKNMNPFGSGAAFTWGTTNTLLGIKLKVILYKDLTGSNAFDSLAVFQRDYVLGKNPWGISFIHNIGSFYPKQLHSQIAFFRNGYHPGALTAGPAPKSILSNYSIERKNTSYFDIFNYDDAIFYDDWQDYVTNEPAIVSNATAVFVFGNLQQRR